MLQFHSMPLLPEIIQYINYAWQSRDSVEVTGALGQDNTFLCPQQGIVTGKFTRQELRQVRTTFSDQGCDVNHFIELFGLDRFHQTHPSKHLFPPSSSIRRVK